MNNLTNRLLIMKDVIEKSEPKPWMIDFDKGQLYAIEKILEYIEKESTK